MRVRRTIVFKRWALLLLTLYDGPNDGKGIKVRVLLSRH